MIRIVQLCLLLTVAFSFSCPPSHFDYVGPSALAMQHYLNSTFTAIEERIDAIGNVTYSPSLTSSYSVFNAKLNFRVRDSNQKANIFGNDTIVMFDANVEAEVQFLWSKTTMGITLNGTGTALGISKKIIFAYIIIVEKSDERGLSYKFQLLDWEDIQWPIEEAFRLREVYPSGTTEDDRAILTRMLNQVEGQRSLRNHLEEEVNKIYSYFLRNSIVANAFDQYFDYVWSPGYNRPNVTIPMHQRLISILVEYDGIRSRYDVQAEQAIDWKCPQRPVPPVPLYPKTFGQVQQFISFDFYENMLRHAISKNILDTSLDYNLWGSTVFHFVARDLYEVIPVMQTRFGPAEEVKGHCNALYSGLRVWRSGSQTFNTSVQFDCDLSVRREKFVNFRVNLELEIQGFPDDQSVNFILKRHSDLISFYPFKDYIIEDIDKAELMVKASLKRLSEHKLFGSGFPINYYKAHSYYNTEEAYTFLLETDYQNPSLGQEE